MSPDGCAMILYRIENKQTLLGPFTHVLDRNYSLNGCDCPCPYDIVFTHNHKFAVQELKSLFQYFGPAMESLHKANFHIIKISISEQFVVEGKGQCVYLWLNGTIIATYSVLDARNFIEGY